MNKHYLNLISLGAIFIFFGLACGTKHPPKPEAVTAFGDVCKTENNRRDVTTEGFVRPAKPVDCRRTARATELCAVELYDNPSYTGKPVTVRFKRGDGASEMAGLPEKFTLDDMKFKTDAGETLGPKDKFRISGYTENSGNSDDVKEFGCFINVKKIERAK